jgi:conjugal transfer ATP-binding protein TraC
MPCPIIPNDAIAAQAIRHDIELVILKTACGSSPSGFVPPASVKDGVPEIGTVYPDSLRRAAFCRAQHAPRWAPWECARLIGDLFTDKLRFPCPAATMLCLVYPDQEAASAKAGFKFMRTTSLAGTAAHASCPASASRRPSGSMSRPSSRRAAAWCRVFYG